MNVNDATVLKVRCSSSTSRQMKVLAAELGCSLGDLLRAIGFMVQTRQLTHGQLAQAIAQVGNIPETGWVGEGLPEHRAYLSRVAALAREVGDLSTAASFERKAAHIGMDAGPIEKMGPTYDRNEKLLGEV